MPDRNRQSLFPTISDEDGSLLHRLAILETQMRSGPGGTILGQTNILLQRDLLRNLNCGHLLFPGIMTSKGGCSSTLTHAPTLEHVTHIWTLMNSKTAARHCCDALSCMRDLTFFVWSNDSADLPLFFQSINKQMKNWNVPCSQHVTDTCENITHNAPDCLTLVIKKQQARFSAKPHNNRARSAHDCPSTYSRPSRHMTSGASTASLVRPQTAFSGRTRRCLNIFGTHNSGSSIFHNRVEGPWHCVHVKIVRFSILITLKELVTC